jgi:ABC-type uncharacterized transport system permease subunit
MTFLWLNFLTLAFYLAASALLLRRLTRAEAAAGPVRLGILTLVAGGLALHAALLIGRLGLGLDVGINLGITSAFSLVSWTVVVLYLFGSLARPVENLGILILPFAALTVLLEWLWPSGNLFRDVKGPAAVHIVVSVVAYGLLCLAATQALLLAAQERGLRRHKPGGFLRALPPMQTMEQLMFQMIGIGFVLLTATVVSGIFFSEQVFGKPLKLTHHILLSVLAWAVYGTLLIGRWRLGWRGPTAIRWTLAGFVLLVLGYFGSKFVVEVLLGRT